MRSKATWMRLLAIIAVWAVAQSGWAAGFALYEGSARANALGGTLIGRADDPSALFFNPAGITQLPGTELMGGVTFIWPSVEVTTFTPVPVTTKTERNLYLPPHLYATHQLTESFWVGLGCFSRFGLGTEFNKTWPGRYNNYNAEISTLTINPNIAWKITDQISIAAGLSAMWFDLTLEQMLPLAPGMDLPLKLEGDSFEGFGFNVALRYQPFDWLALGVAYQSEAEQSLDGHLKIEQPVMPLSLDASGDVTLPQMVFLGLMLKPIEQLSIEVGAIWTGWSSYDQLKIGLKDPTVFGTDTLVMRKDWDDVWRYQVGAEFALTEQVLLRAGYVYDEDPMPDRTVDYLVPSSNRHLFNVGIGFRQTKWAIDLGYTFLLIEDRDLAGRLEDGVFPGKFDNGNAHMVGITLSTRL